MLTWDPADPCGRINSSEWSREQHTLEHCNEKVDKKNHLFPICTHVHFAHFASLDCSQELSYRTNCRMIGIICLCICIHTDIHICL